MIKHKAVVDLDDTLGGLRYVLMDTMNSIMGTDIHWADWNVLRMEDIYGITNDEFLTIAEKHMILERSRPHREAREFMQRLRAEGIETTILTARSWHPRADSMTEHWLALYDIPYTELAVCDLEYDKSNYIRHMDNVLFTVDDSARHCLRYADAQPNRPKHVFAYDMPWNRNLPDDIIRVGNLNRIFDYIEGL